MLSFFVFGLIVAAPGPLHGARTVSSHHFSQAGLEPGGPQPSKHS